MATLVLVFKKTESEDKKDMPLFIQTEKQK